MDFDPRWSDDPRERDDYGRELSQGSRGGLSNPRELDAVQLGELPVVVGRAEALELLLRLLAQVRAIDEEQHAPGAAELDQPVKRRDGQQRLARCRWPSGSASAGGRRTGSSRCSRPPAPCSATCRAIRPAASPAGAREVSMASCRRRPCRSRPDCFSQASSVSAVSHSRSVSGRWNENTGRVRGCGSKWLMKSVSSPVERYANGSGL